MLITAIESFHDRDMVPVYREKQPVCRKDLNMSTAGSSPTFPAASN